MLLPRILQPNTITQSDGDGTTTFNGTLNTNTAGGINLTGAGFQIQQIVTTTLNGLMSVSNSSLLQINANLMLNSSFTQSGTGTVNLGANITFMQGSLSFASPITLTGDSVLTCTSSSNMTFSSTINGGFDLALNCGSGTIQFLADVGGIAPLDVFQVTAAANVSTQDFYCGSIVQLVGTGTTTFNGDLTTTDLAGISVTGSSFQFLSNVTTSGNVPLAITNADQMTVATGSILNIDGAFTQNGAGAVSLAGTITTGNDDLSFTSPIFLSCVTNLNTGAGVGNLTLSDTVNGAQSLTLASGGGYLVTRISRRYSQAIISNDFKCR